MDSTFAIGGAALEVAADLTRSFSRSERFNRLLDQLGGVISFDAAAVLLFENGKLVPKATRGLPEELFGRRFRPAEHPRFERILNSEGAVLFECDEALPDPYDGMLTEARDASVHSCMGARLAVEQTTLGVITVDAAAPDQFSEVDVERLKFFAAIAAAAVQAADRIERLERLTRKQQEVVSHISRGPTVELIGDSEEMQRVHEEIAIVADSDVSVLVAGETGTGKELVARKVHELSSRNRNAFVCVNCAALPESIAESELFGHVRGAFSGAVKDRMGHFELAEGGTIFLDEVGELDQGIQAKLLRTIQFGEVQRLGAESPRTVDVRIIAATNRDLREEVDAGRFREDLYHRLHVYPIKVPPLRDRLSDITKLAGHFLEKYQGKLGTSPLRLSDDSLELLKQYSWPGNVRELEHVLMRAALRAAALSRDSPWVVIDEHELGISPDTSNYEGVGLRAATEEFQRRLIISALRDADGNYAEAARRLEMDRSNLHRLAQRLDVKPPS
jgi:anaerobic nitric oxide reductase transcription regulator